MNMWSENSIIMMSVQEEADAKRTDICSEATLCANDIGFFAEVADKLLDAAKEDDWLEKVFSNINGDSEKIEAVMQNENVSTVLKTILSRLEPHFRTKNAQISQSRRHDAQRALMEGNLRKALAICSQAVIRAPLPDDNEVFEEGLTLAYAFWQRSEILLKMNKFELAMQDLKISLTYRLPAKIRGNYYWRLGHCYKGLKDFGRAKVAYELAQRLVRDDVERNSITTDLLSIEGTGEVPQQQTNEGAKQIKLTGGAKENLPALSRLVKISESEAMGKFAVAASRIHTGDVLLVEQPYAACLLPNFYGTHCHHCFNRLEAPMACPNCSGVAFCSTNCRDIAVSTYHSIECSFMAIFLGSGMSILSQIALRMITQAGIDLSLAIHAKYFTQDMSVINNIMMSNIDGVSKAPKFRRSRKDRSNRDARSSLEKVQSNNGEDTKEAPHQKPADIFDKATLLESIEGRAGQIYSLVTHSNLRKPDDYFRRLVMSIFLKECLKKLNFFKMDIKEKLKKDELAITELLLRNLQLLQFNAHSIYETVCGKHRFSGSKLIYKAVGIYPTGALFNHECYPAVARYFDGKNIVLRANRPLTTGSVVSENYGPHFYNKNSTERQKDLICRYWFKCQCVACTENWPVLKNNQVASTPQLRCPNIACRNKIAGKVKTIPTNCLTCGEPISEEQFIYKLDVVKDCVKQYQVGAQLMQDENVEKAITTLSAAVDTFCSVALPPHKDTQVSQEALRSCFADYGSVYQILDDDN